MSRWFRWYEGSVEDGKFRVVARESRVTLRDVIALWAFILEDAAHLDHRGVCERNEDFMSAVLDFEDGEVENILSSMQNVGLISVGYGAITVCNFSKRQFESDIDRTAGERQRRKRERDRERDIRTANGHVTRDSRPPDTDTDTEESSNEDSSFRASPENDPPVTPKEILKAWAERMVPQGFPAVRKMTATRERQLRARIRDSTVDDWHSAFAALERSKFLRGENSRGWRADFDFLLQPKSFAKLIEGAYDH